MSETGPPIRINRRKFLGCSAVAGLAWSQGAPGSEEEARGVGSGGEARGDRGGAVGSWGGGALRLGLIGAGNRGTALLRAALEIPEATIVAVADPEGRHGERARGIAQRASNATPAIVADAGELLARGDVDAVIVATPCDTHAAIGLSALAAGKHLYLEKPMAPTLSECDALIEAARRAPELAVRVGHQRRHHPRHRELAALALRGELGTLREGRACWTSSNGPVSGHGGWLGRRARSGDWMVEQAVHVWDLYNWVLGGPPSRAYGHGRRDVFADRDPDRDVTDQYTVVMEWDRGFALTYQQSWADPADDAFTGCRTQLLGSAGGLDFSTGGATFRDGRGRLSPDSGSSAGGKTDTRLAIREFVDAARSARGGSVAKAGPMSLEEARAAVAAGLLARAAVDRRGIAEMREIDAGRGSSRS